MLEQSDSKALLITTTIDTNVSMPGIINPSDWQAFEEMRVAIKSPMTERAKKMAWKELVDFDKKGYDVNSIESNVSISLGGIVSKLTNWRTNVNP